MLLAHINLIVITYRYLEMTKKEARSEDFKKTMNNQGRVRVQFDMTKKTVDQLDLLRDKINSSSRAYVVRKALSLFDWIIEKVEEGYDIYLEKDGEREKIVIPDLKD
ncbi:MAG: hypothetical protein ACMUIU_15150 [bacterium]